MKYTTLATFILSTLTTSLYAGENFTTSTAAQTEQTATADTFATAAQAIREGDLETLETLDNLQSLVDANTGNTLLHIAAAEVSGENIEAITAFLFNQGVDGDAENKEGLTPTDVCIEEDNFRFRAAYNKHKSTATEKKETDTNDDFATAAQAIREGDLETLQTLDNLQSLVNKDTGNTLLHIAATVDQGQNIEAITAFIINKGIDRKVKNKVGLTAIEIAKRIENFDFLDVHPDDETESAKEETTEQTAVTFEDSDTESEDLDDKFQAYMGAETRGRYLKDSE